MVYLGFTIINLGLRTFFLPAALLKSDPGAKIELYYGKGSKSGKAGTGSASTILVVWRQIP